MAFGKLLSLILLAFFSVSVVSAQVMETDAERRERERRDAELVKKVNLRQLPVLELGDLVPGEPDSWLVSVVVHDAWTKTSKIAATVKSDGNFLCRNENLKQNHPIAALDFDAFNGLVGDFRSDLVPALEPVTECKDCTVETLQISLRTKKKKVKTYVYNLDNHQAGFSLVRRIYNEMNDIAKCD